MSTANVAQNLTAKFLLFSGCFRCAADRIIRIFSANINERKDGGWIFFFVLKRGADDRQVGERLLRDTVSVEFLKQAMDDPQGQVSFRVRDFRCDQSGFKFCFVGQAVRSLASVVDSFCNCSLSQAAKGRPAGRVAA